MCKRGKTFRTELQHLTERLSIHVKKRKGEVHQGKTIQERGEEHTQETA